jgi:hypothetical protein
MITAAGLALFTWWFISGLGICPADGDPALACRAEASRIGLKFAAAVAGFVALFTVAILLSKRSVDH